MLIALRIFCGVRQRLQSGFVLQRILKNLLEGWGFGGIGGEGGGFLFGVGFEGGREELPGVSMYVGVVQRLY